MMRRQGISRIHAVANGQAWDTGSRGHIHIEGCIADHQAVLGLPVCSLHDLMKALGMRLAVIYLIRGDDGVEPVPPAQARHGGLQATIAFGGGDGHGLALEVEFGDEFRNAVEGLDQGLMALVVEGAVGGQHPVHGQLIIQWEGPTDTLLQRQANILQPFFAEIQGKAQEP